MNNADKNNVTLTLNPSLSLSLTWSVRVANRPYGRYRMEIPQDVELARWLLGTLAQGCTSSASEFQVEAGEELLELAARRGLVVTEETDPGEATAFACELDPSLLPWVSAEDRQAAAELIVGASRLALNPDLEIQCSDALPDALAGQVLADDSLRTRIGSMPPAIEGIPSGLRSIAGSSRIWVAHPVTHVWQPYEATPEMVALLSELSDGRDPRSLPAPLLEILVLGDVVRPVSVASPGAREDDASRFAEWRAQLERDGYAVVRNIVSPLQLAALKAHYRQLEQAGYLETDTFQVKEQRDGIYCEFITLYLQDQVGRFLNRFLPEPVKPSYTWFFRYRSQAVLHRHKDRPQCRWNVSFAIDASPDLGREGAWPICFQVGEESRSVLLGAGDAVVYSGTDVEHWRDELPAGHTVSMCFLHYVKADFDGRLA